MSINYAKKGNICWEFFPKTPNFANCSAKYFEQNEIPKEQKQEQKTVVMPFAGCKKGILYVKKAPISILGRRGSNVRNAASIPFETHIWHRATGMPGS